MRRLRPVALALAVVDVVAAVAVALATGCAPTFNWREVSLAGGVGTSSFPCKPSQEQRQVALAGAPVAMTIQACQAGGLMFSIGSADVVDPARVGPALVAMKNAAAGNLGGRGEPWAVTIPGQTPHPLAGGQRIAGRLPDGREVAERLAVFAHGTRVYQAIVFGPQLPEDAVENFFTGIRLR